MARIAGVDIPNNKAVSVSLLAVYGIGRHTAGKILAEASVDPIVKVNELTDAQVGRINNIIEKNYKVEGELRQKTFSDVKRLKDIRAYRGIRHKVGLPVRGQNTRTNGRTRKGKNLAVGGLNRKIDKK